LKIEGELWTPTRECGLLNGVQRRRLMKAGIIRERIIKNEEIGNAEQIWLINAIRGWIPATVEF
jgi:para-aminobenzoate synthetase / 4-amino-4-deoxychorismate lyase